MKGKAPCVARTVIQPATTGLDHVLLPHGSVQSLVPHFPAAAAGVAAGAAFGAAFGAAGAAGAGGAGAAGAAAAAAAGRSTHAAPAPWGHCPAPHTREPPTPLSHPGAPRHTVCRTVLRCFPVGYQSPWSRPRSILVPEPEPRGKLRSPLAHPQVQYRPSATMMVFPTWDRPTTPGPGVSNAAPRS